MPHCGEGIGGAHGADLSEILHKYPLFEVKRSL